MRSVSFLYHRQSGSTLRIGMAAILASWVHGLTIGDSRVASLPVCMEARDRELGL